MEPTTTMDELRANLEQAGWQVKKIDFKGGRYVAKGVGPGGQQLERHGQSANMALAALYQGAIRVNDVRRFSTHSGDHVQSWATIADSYKDLPVLDEKAVPAWRALATECKEIAEEISQQLKIEVTDDPEPYETADDLCEDVQERRTAKISSANTNHPVWDKDEQIAFRTVFEVLGRCAANAQYSWVGVNRAFNALAPALSRRAQQALFVEAVGQAAHIKAHGGVEPKVGLMEEELGQKSSSNYYPREMYDEIFETMFHDNMRGGMPEQAAREKAWDYTIDLLGPLKRRDREEQKVANESVACQMCGQNANAVLRWEDGTDIPACTKCEIDMDRMLLAGDKLKPAGRVSIWDWQNEQRAAKTAKDFDMGQATPWDFSDESEDPRDRDPWMPAGHPAIKSMIGEGLGPGAGAEEIDFPFERGDDIEVMRLSKDWDSDDVNKEVWVPGKFIEAFRWQNGAEQAQVWIWPTRHMGDGWDQVPGGVRLANLDQIRPVQTAEAPDDLSDLTSDTPEQMEWMVTNAKTDASQWKPIDN